MGRHLTGEDLLRWGVSDEIRTVHELAAASRFDDARIEPSI